MGVKHLNEIPTKNLKLIKWVFDRCAGTIDAKETAIGYIPKAGDIDLNGLEEEVTAEEMKALLSVDVAGWKNEMESVKELLCALWRQAAPGTHRPAQRPQKAA